MTEGGGGWVRAGEGWVSDICGGGEDKIVAGEKRREVIAS